MIRLPFAGRVGGDYPTDQEVNVTVPCVDMFAKNTCPIIAETRPWWNDESKKDKARRYYKKRTYIFQGFVVASPFEEASVPENPIRRFVINQSIFEIIKAVLMNPDMEDLPTDFSAGRDFKIAKTKKGDYANYSTSTWSFRTRPLNDTEHAAIEKFGLFNLGQFLGNRPDADGIAMIKAMFHDSVVGKPFDHDSYGAHYRAYGDRDNRSSDSDASSQVQSNQSRPTGSQTVSRPVQQDQDEGAPSAATASAGSSSGTTQASDILDRIRRKTQSA
jgi:hypothetical protein